MKSIKKLLFIYLPIFVVAFALLTAFVLQQMGLLNKKGFNEALDFVSTHSISETYKMVMNDVGGGPPPVFILYVKDDVRMQRGFFDYKEDSKQRLPHSVAVGDPAGINYVYDLKSGNLVSFWHGGYIDATPMWRGRGDGTYTQLGEAMYLSNSQSLAFFDNAQGVFPKTGEKSSYRGKGYRINEQTGHPVFSYQYQGITVSDAIMPLKGGTGLSHQVTLSDHKSPTQSLSQSLYYKLAEGSQIEATADGSYVVDDQQYQIKVYSADKPIIRELNGQKQLVILLKSDTINYSLSMKV